MFIPRKKDVLNELALCLYMLLEFNPDTTALSVMQRIHARSQEALASAKHYIGAINQAAVRHFLTATHHVFSVDCGKDIVIGDIIRFMERVQDNRSKPPRDIGKRGIIAKIIGINTTDPKKPMFVLKVISSGGDWRIKADEQIYRTPKIITRMEVMRTAWEDERLRASAPRINRSMTRQAKRPPLGKSRT